MSIDQVFGYLGCILLVTTLIPQIVKTYKTKKMDDISILFIALQNLTCITFLAYGCLLEEYPLIIANSIVELQSLLLLGMKIMYSNDDIILPSMISTEDQAYNGPYMTEI